MCVYRGTKHFRHVPQYSSLLQILASATTAAPSPEQAALKALALPSCPHHFLLIISHPRVAGALSGDLPNAHRA